jgi:hypothetical protein
LSNRVIESQKQEKPLALGLWPLARGTPVFGRLAEVQHQKQRQKPGHPARESRYENVFLLEVKLGRITI